MKVGVLRYRCRRCHKTFSGKTIVSEDLHSVLSSLIQGRSLYVPQGEPVLLLEIHQECFVNTANSGLGIGECIGATYGEE